MPRIPHLIPVLAAPAIAAGLIAFAAGSSPAQGQTSRTLELTELQKGATFKHIRNTKPATRRANSAGDVIVFTSRLADPSGKDVGKLSAACITTTGARNFVKSVITCDGAVALSDGTLTWQAEVRPDAATTTGAITGGTGAYANARGVFVSEVGPDGAHDTITLAG